MNTKKGMRRQMITSKNADWHAKGKYLLGNWDVESQFIQSMT
jgi:hypothetical protein